MMDVIRSLWRRPTAFQKRADRNFLNAGGQLIVIASERSKSVSHRPTWVRRGPLNVSQNKMTWSTRNHEDEIFSSHDWELLPSPGPAQRQLQQITLVSKSNSSIRRQLRVPIPDIELIHWAMDTDPRD